LLVVLVIAGATGIVADIAGAQTAQVLTQTITIKKTVVGTAPPGTVFTIHADCGGGHVGDFSFNQAGGSTAVPPPITSGTCTFTETATGGATSVSGSCDVITGTASCSGSTLSSPKLMFNDVSFTATIEFTNTGPFAVAPATATTTTPPAPVVVGPRFTG
jgi:hypothetical protein